MKGKGNFFSCMMTVLFSTSRNLFEEDGNESETKRRSCDLLLLEDHKDSAPDAEQQDEADDRTDEDLQQAAVL